MKSKLLTICAVALMVSSIVSAADVAGWDAFIIRNSTTGDIAPTISDHASGGKLFQITLGGQKAGWATNSMNGKKVGHIQSLSIIRDSSVTGWGPYMNFWITDGQGGYAIIANEPSHTWEWTGSSAYDTTWDVLKNATTWVYEVDSTKGFKLPDGTITTVNLPAGTIDPFTFSDFANYTIATPPSHWGGTGAPDDLNASTYTAYGFNWVFGDTQSNYLDGYLVSNPTLIIVTEVWVDAVNGSDSNLGTEAEPFATIQKGIDTVGDGGTVNVAAGTYDEGLITIDKSLSIEGDPLNKPLIKPTENTISGHTGWFEITGATSVANFKNLAFDGSGQNINQCIRYEEGPSGNVENCDFSNISDTTYVGIGVCFVDYTAYGGGVALDINPDGLIKDCTFTNIERIGVSVFGVDKVSVKNCVYTGKGNIDCLDYGIEVGGGGVAEIKNSTITECTGVASSDGSTSAGILVTTYYGSGTQATITKNTLTNNTGGIAVGYDASDTSTVVARYNNISGNTDYGIDTTAPLVNAIYNWWGTAVEGTIPSMISGTGSVDYSPILLTNQINMAAGAARLVELQNNDGGWDWPLDDGNPDSGSTDNTVGPTAMGLAKAYRATRDPDILTALQKAKAFLLTKTDNFVGPDGYLADELDSILGGTACVDYVNTNFFDKLAAGTYYDARSAQTHNTTTYVQAQRDRRSGSIANLAAWDVGMCLVGAASAGVSGGELDIWIAGVKAEIDELDGSAYYDVIGLAGGIYGLAFVNEDFDPAGEHEAASSLADLADILATYQLSTGGFTWNSEYMGEGDDNEAIQETAYSILALQEVGGYTSVVEDAVEYLKSVQLCTGGWENYTGSGENNEVTAEAMWALGPWNLLELNVAAPSLYVQPGENVITDMDVANLLQMVNSCQAMLGYSSTYLDASAGCVVAGGPPWDDLIYNSWAIGSGIAGEIDTAIGIDAASEEPTVGTDADNTVAVITLKALTEGITEIVFRPDIPDDETEQTMLSGMDSESVWPSKIYSQTIVIDDTDPVVTDLTATQIRTAITFPEIDGIVSEGEWDDATQIPAKDGIGTISVMADDSYLYVLFDLTDSTDARLGENLKGNDQISINVNPTDGGSWGFPYDIIFETSADLPWNPKVNSGITDGWNSRWLVNDTQYVIPDDLDTHTTYSGGKRITEWKLPISSISPAMGDTLNIGGAVEVGDGSSYVYPIGLDWNVASTFRPIVVGLQVDVLNCANTTLQGTVEITVDASDALAGLVGVPTITVIGPETLTAILVDGVGPVYGWEVEILPTTLNGTYTITITATDKADNATTVTGTLCVNKNQITGSVELENLFDTSRAVTFVATGGAQKEWTPTLSFTDSVADLTLTDVPCDTTALSAKAAWNLRVKITGLDLTDADGQEVVNFTSTDKLRGGDLNGTNGINILDYSVLRMNWFTHEAVADINGDGNVNVPDFLLLKNNWFQKGDDL